MALLVYFGILIALAFRYSYLLLAPEPVAMPELNLEQVYYLKQQAIHKHFYFSALMALCLVGWSLNIQAAKKSLKRLLRAFCGLLSMYLINDVVFKGEFGMIDHVSTTVFSAYSLYLIYPITKENLKRHGDYTE